MSGWWSLITVATGLLLIPPTALCFFAGIPRVWAPLPVHIFVLAVLIRELVVVVPTLLFWIWIPGLFRGRTDVPRRSFAALGFLLVVNLVWYVGSWSYGLEYQGRTHTIAVGAGSLVFATVLAILAVRASRRPTWIASLSFHWILFLWFGWYALPYLGELP